MSEQQSMFGDDINATNINSLTMPPHAAMSSKNDIGAPGPLEPPIYSPSVEIQQQRRVTFDDEPHIQEIPRRADLVADEDRRRDRDRSRRRDRHSSRRSSRSSSRSRSSSHAPEKMSKKKPKTRRIVQLASEYAHRAVVAALVCIILWYYPKIAALPYVGTGYGHLRMLAIFGISVAAAGTYGIVESILD